MNEKIIYQFHKNKKEEVICTLKTWNNKTFFDIRVFYRNSNNELKPTSKGICLADDKLMYIQIIADELKRKVLKISQQQDGLFRNKQLF